ncbi:MAG TPA: helix-turn-helix transcriptional regulator [Paenibacillaceae bacterium]
MTTFGKRLKQARGRRGLTQNQVAEMLGIDFTTLSKYENDKSQPDHQTLRELASMYEVSIDWLLTGERLPNAGIPPNRLTVGDVEEELTDEEAARLLEYLEMLRLLRAKREKERRQREKEQAARQAGAERKSGPWRGTGRQQDA